MKHPLLFLLAFVDLNGFSQAPDTLLQQFDKIWTSGLRTLTVHPWRNGEYDTLSFDIRMRPRYDTIRAVLLVSYIGRRLKRIPFTMPGFVVQRLKTVIGSIRDYDTIYLDDKKKVIKAPLKVFMYVKD